MNLAVLRRLGGVALPALLLACAGPPKSGLQKTLPARVPLAVVVTAEIEGSQLGLPLRAPRGLASGSHGTVYVADAGNDRLLKLDSAMKAVAEIGGRGGAWGLLNRPTFLTMDNNLNLLVVDEGNRRVARFDNRLNYVDEIPFTDEDDLLKFGYPAGVAVNEFGEVWVTDGEKDRVAIFDHIGRFDRFVGDLGYTGGQLDEPGEIVYSREGSMFVCDVGNRRLVAYDSYGSLARRIPLDDLAAPTAMALDEAGFWIVDREQAVLQLRDHEGRLLFDAGSQLPGTARSMAGPSDVTLLSGDRLLVADTGNDRLLVCRLVYE
jgi:DNA-binding beta-propeller fold protein YncE